MNPLIEFTKWLLKWIGIVVGGLLAIGAIVLAAALGLNWWNHNRHVGNIQIVVTHKGAAVPPSKVVANGNAVEGLCSDEFPVFVGYTNGSTRTVEYVQIDVSARLPDHSSNILRYDSNVKMDRIVPPGEGFGHCVRFQFDELYKSHPKTEQAIYRGRINHIRFTGD